MRRLDLFEGKEKKKEIEVERFSEKQERHFDNISDKMLFSTVTWKDETNKLWWKIFEENEEKNCRNIEENAIKKRKKQNSQTATW